MELEILEAKINEFNPFNVLKVDSYEIRHSNFLAWLFDPKQNHFLGDLFLKKFLSNTLIENSELDVELTVFQVHEANLQDLEVRREWRNIDLLIVSESNNFVIFIENKIHSKESEKQLEEYYSIVSDEYKGYQLIPIFLTLNGQPPSSSKYVSVSYTRIHSLLQFTLSHRQENLNPKVYDFINYYLKILEVLTLDNTEVQALCKKIYKTHKKAIDLINKFAYQTDFEDAIEEFIDQNDEPIKKIKIDGKNAIFLPKNIEDKIKMVGDESWHNGYPFVFWFRALDEKIGLVIEIGPFQNSELRQKFLQLLQAEGFKINQHAFNIDRKYTRIYSQYPEFEDWDNKDKIIEKLNNILKQSTTVNAIKQLVVACEKFPEFKVGI